MDSVTKIKLEKPLLARMVQSALPGEELLAAQELSEGCFATAHLLTLQSGREVVLKVAPPADVRLMRYEKDIMATEVACMRLAAANTTLPVARVLFHDASRALCPSEYFMMEKLPGQSLSSLDRQVAPEEQAAIQRELGAYNAQLNGIHGEYFGYFSQPNSQSKSWSTAFKGMLAGVLADTRDVDGELPLGAYALPSRLDEAWDLFDEVKTPSLVHWDLWPGNVFVLQGKISGLIDFERCLWADPLMELGFRSHRINSDFLAGYGLPTLTPQQQARMLWYDLYLQIIHLTEEKFRNYHDEEMWQSSWHVLARGLAQLGL